MSAPDKPISTAGHLLIEGVFSCIPPVGSVFTLEDRKKWFRAFISVSDLLYPGGAPIDVQIVRGEIQFVTAKTQPQPNTSPTCLDCGGPRSPMSAARCRGCYLQRAAKMRAEIAAAGAPP